VLDAWVAEAGDTEVVRAVEELAAAAASGKLPLLRDVAALRAYWGSRHQRA